MIRILHTGDLHFCNKKALLDDIIKCTDFLLNQAAIELPDLIVIAGDIFDEGVLLGSPASLAAIEFVQKCSMVCCPVIIIRGTSTHDAENSLDVLNKLRSTWPIYIADRPEQVALTRDNKFVTVDPGQYQETYKAVISCLPSITKSNLMAIGASRSIETTSREVMDIMRDILQAFGIVNDQARAKGVPTVLICHGTVTGSVLSTGQTMVGRDIEYTTGDLKLAHCDLYCLAHIHKAQSWGNIFYSGSITRLNYGETEKKLFLIHEISDGSVTTREVGTPARTMRTKRPEGLPSIEIVEDVQEGDNIRIVYTISEADVGKVDEQAIISAALAKGAVDVKIEKVIVPTVRVRAEGISREHTLLAKLLKWTETTGITLNGNVSYKLDLLETMEVEQVLEGYKGVNENAA